MEYFEGSGKQKKGGGGGGGAPPAAWEATRASSKGKNNSQYNAAQKHAHQPRKLASRREQLSSNKGLQIELALEEQRERARQQQRSVTTDTIVAPEVSRLDIRGYQYDSTTDRYYKSSVAAPCPNSRSPRMTNLLANGDNLYQESSDRSSCNSNSNSGGGGFFVPPTKRKKFLEASFSSPPLVDNIHMDLLNNFSKLNFEKFAGMRLRLRYDISYYSEREARQNRSCHISFHPDYGLATFMMQDRELAIRTIITDIASKDDVDTSHMRSKYVAHPFVATTPPFASNVNPHPQSVFGNEVAGISWRPLPSSQSSAAHPILAVCVNSTNHGGCHINLFRPDLLSDNPSEIIDSGEATRSNWISYNPNQISNLSFTLNGLDWDATGETLFLLSSGASNIRELRPDNLICGSDIKLPSSSNGHGKNVNVSTCITTMKSSPSLRVIGLRNGNISLYDNRSRNHSLMSNTLIGRQGNGWLSVDHLCILRDEFSVIAQDITGKIISIDSRFQKSEIGVICDGFDNNRIRKRKFWVSPCESFLCSSYENKRANSVVNANDCGLASYSIKNYCNRDASFRQTGIGSAAAAGSEPLHTTYLPISFEARSGKSSSYSPQCQFSRELSPKYVCKSWMQLTGNNNYSGANYENLSSVHCCNPFTGLFGSVFWENAQGVVSLQTILEGYFS